MSELTMQVLKDVLKLWAEMPPPLIRDGETLFVSPDFYRRFRERCPIDPRVPELPYTIFGVHFSVDHALPPGTAEVRDKDGKAVDMRERLKTYHESHEPPPLKAPFKSVFLFTPRS